MAVLNLMYVSAVFERWMKYEKLLSCNGFRVLKSPGISLFCV